MLPITVILTPSYSDWEIAPLTGAGRAFFDADISFASPSGGALSSAAGLPIGDIARFSARQRGVVVICGGPAWETDPPELSEALQASLANGCILAAICGGTIGLARAGLLDAVRHTSNAPGYIDGLVPSYRGAALYEDQPHALHDGPIITAPAPAPVSFAFEVLVAAGLGADKAGQMRDLLAREHQAARAS